MEFHHLLLHSFLLLFFALVASHAYVDPHVDFKSVLPKEIHDSLSNEKLCNYCRGYWTKPFKPLILQKGKGSPSFVLGKPKETFPGYDDAASDQQIMAMRILLLYFLDKDMHVGKSFNLHISKDTTTTTPFVPRKVADSLPVSSKKLQDIYKAFNVHPGSVEGESIKKTVNECEKASNKEEDQYCATSFESMVDYATSKLGKRAKALSTQVNGHEITPLQGYKVEEVKKLNEDNVIACHQMYYPYAIYFCHKAPKVNTYKISLVGEHNVKANAITICHEDTAASWNQKHSAFQALNVKPGREVVCHFLPEGEIAWVPY